MQITISNDLTFVASCLLTDREIQLMTVTQDYRNIRYFHLSPANRVEGLRLKYTRGEILLSPLSLSNQIRQLKTWPINEEGS